MNNKFVAYYRVSTQRQGQSGLGINAQKNMIRQYCNGKGSVIAEYKDIVSGRKNKSKGHQLEIAINKALQQNCTLIIAKLDRLSRDAEFIFKLQKSDVDFICADMPEANRLTIGIMAVLANHEIELISERTKAALAEKKKQGFKLGSPQNLTDESRKRSIQSRKKQALEQDANKKAFLIIQDLRSQDMGYYAIASKLNGYGLKTVKGKCFKSTSVRRIYDMYTIEAEIMKF